MVSHKSFPSKINFINWSGSCNCYFNGYYCRSMLLFTAATYAPFCGELHWSLCVPCAWSVRKKGARCQRFPFFVCFCWSCEKQSFWVPSGCNFSLSLWVVLNVVEKRGHCRMSPFFDLSGSVLRCIRSLSLWVVLNVVRKKGAPPRVPFLFIWGAVCFRCMFLPFFCFERIHTFPFCFFLALWKDKAKIE